MLAARLADLVGAQDIFDGKTTSLSGATARGSTLILRLQERAADFPIRASVCVVPASLPVDAEGVKPPIPSAAPYFVAGYVPNERVVLERNRFYTGPRPHHPTRFIVEMASIATIVERVKAGDIGLAGAGAMGPFLGELAQSTASTGSSSAPVGHNHTSVRAEHEPTLFRKNPSFARPSASPSTARCSVRVRTGGGDPTDKYRPSSRLHERDGYPLKGPDLKKARTARGPRSRKVVLYVRQPDVYRTGARRPESVGLSSDVQFPLFVLFEAGDRQGRLRHRVEGSGHGRA